MLLKQYRLVTNGVIGPPSMAGWYNINLNDYNLTGFAGPTMVLDFPSGLPLNGGLQTQMLNLLAPHLVTFRSASAASPTETVDVAITPCTENCPGPPLATVTPGPYDFTWDWLPSTGPSTYTALQLQSTDEAGNQSGTTSSQAVFTLFDPTTTPLPLLTCGSEGQPCPFLAAADEGSGDIPGDPSSCAQQPTPTGVMFCGYADPSIRRDSVVNASATPANPWGTNLFMLYSFLLLNTTTWQGSTVYIPALETHLASSTTGDVSFSGAGLDWCSGADCSGTTVIYPSVRFTGTCYDSQSQQYVPCYSSHEVPNFWEDPPAMQGGTPTWYAAHLMYYVPVTNRTIPPNVQDGCLVISWATGSPANLAWSSGQHPSSCAGQFPTGSKAIQFSDLNVAAGPPGNPLACTTWGQPAVMVSSAFPQSSGQKALYLAAVCFTNTFETPTLGGYGYYVFWTPVSSLPNVNWQVALGPFNQDQLTGLQGYPFSTDPNPNALIELDWAVRPDGSIVGVVSTEKVDVGSQTAKQDGCMAVNFDMNPSDGNPFTSIITSVTDNDVSGAFSEDEQGPGACTYEPTSNTGIAIVRHLVNSGSGSFQGKWSIMSSGRMP